MPDVRSTMFSRREGLRQILGAGGCLPFARLMAALPLGQQSAQGPVSLSGLAPLSPEDDWFLNELEIANLSYFWDQASPKTGMVKDRCHVNGLQRHEPAGGDARDRVSVGAVHVVDEKLHRHTHTE